MHSLAAIRGGLILAVFSVASLPQPLQARQSEMGTRLVQQLKERLGLTNEQVAKVEALVRKREEKRKAARPSSGDSPEARAERREQMREFQAEVEALLTDEQKVKYAELKAERRERMRELRQGGASPRPSPSPTPSPKP